MTDQSVCFTCVIYVVPLVTLGPLNELKISHRNVGGINISLKGITQRDGSIYMEFTLLRALLSNSSMRKLIVLLYHSCLTELFSFCLLLGADQSSHPFNPPIVQGCRGLKLIPADFGWKDGYSMDRSLVHHGCHTNFGSHISTAEQDREHVGQPTRGDVEPVSCHCEVRALNTWPHGHHNDKTTVYATYQLCFHIGPPVGAVVCFCNEDMRTCLQRTLRNNNCLWQIHGHLYGPIMKMDWNYRWLNYQVPGEYRMGVKIIKRKTFVIVLLLERVQKNHLLWPYYTYAIAAFFLSTWKLFSPHHCKDKVSTFLKSPTLNAIFRELDIHRL